MSESSCDICRGIPAFAAADLREGERLPEAASRLVNAHSYPDDFLETAKDYEITKKCPLCGQLYTYGYHYDFSVGYVEESVWLERRTGPRDSQSAGDAPDGGRTG